MPTIEQTRQTFKQFGGNPHRAEEISRFLGFEPISEPANEFYARSSSHLKRFFGVGDGRFDFGVKELYRIGSQSKGESEFGLWVGVLAEWGRSSSDREIARHRISRALIEQVPEHGNLAFLTPPDERGPQEVELILPHVPTSSQPGATSRKVASTRATLNLENPSDFHCSLLNDLSIHSQPSLLDVARRWQSQFSIERISTRFYREYAEVRDNIAGALRDYNPNHRVIQDLGSYDARAWATRQMGRVLFLWFLQAKGWLGEPNGMGPRDYLIELWGKHRNTASGEYYSGVLRPLFFEAMATGKYSVDRHHILGHVPYLNGGLFRTNTLEDQIEAGGEFSLPDRVFDSNEMGSLLGILQKYRFTTRESTPEDQSVDPDPEMLGRVFENLHQEGKRRETGTYYTPREVVHFMCREALDGCLCDEVPGLNKSTLDALRRRATGSHDDNDLDHIFDKTTADGLVSKLESLKICDPAVGSGAYLLGMLQEILLLRRGVLFSQQPHVSLDRLYNLVSQWKRDIVTNNLHGVDINPEAVEICQLRLWLSMVLDMPEPPEQGHHWALPNLDFRIVSGDALVDRVGGITFRESWPPPTAIQYDLGLQHELAQIERRIDERKAEFDRAHRSPQQLRQLRDLISDDQREIIRLQLSDALDKATEQQQLRKGINTGQNATLRAQQRVDELQGLLRQVVDRDFTPVQKPFLWPVAFPDVLRQSDRQPGFDIVLGNPPYVRQERLHPEDKQSHRASFPEVYRGKADILVSFYARALQILKPGGWLAFVTSNKFMRADYGEGIREYLPSALRIHRIVDFGDLPIFRSKGRVVDAYPAVLIGCRTAENGGHEVNVTNLSSAIRKQLATEHVKVTPENVRVALQNIGTLLQPPETQQTPQAFLGRQQWVLEAPGATRFFYDLMNKGMAFGAFGKGRVHYGLKSGFNDALIIDSELRDAIVYAEPHSAEIIKPCLQGRHINRWRAEHGNSFIIAIPNSNDDGVKHPWSHIDIEEDARRIFANAYPAIHNHLSQYVDELRRRRDKGKFWWELRPCRYYHKFDQPKMVWGNLSVESGFASESVGSYVSNPANFLADPEPWLVAIMNSSLLNFIYPRLTVARGSSFQEFKIGYLRSAPIVVPNGQPLQDLCKLVYEIAASDGTTDRVDEIEREIDSIVFHVYEVPTIERKLVLDWLCERREKSGRELTPDWRLINAIRATAGVWRYVADNDQIPEDVLPTLITTHDPPREC